MKKHDPVETRANAVGSNPLFGCIGDVGERIYLSRHPFLDKRSWIYYLWKGNEIVYVGQTKTGILRILAHISDGKEFDSFSFRVVKPWNIDFEEKKEIRRLRPKYNKKHNDERA